jgi:hypothetical protein
VRAIVVVHPTRIVPDPGWRRLLHDAGN